MFLRIFVKGVNNHGLPYVQISASVFIYVAVYVHAISATILEIQVTFVQYIRN